MKNIFSIKEGVPTLDIHAPEELGEYELIDVRRPDEFTGELSHIEGARLVTQGEELDHFLAAQDKNKKILFICRSGARSARATLQAMELGFRDVFNMEGGMLLWNEKGFPIKKQEKKMKCVQNIHPIERMLRVLGGLALISLAFVGPANKWFLLGIIPLITGVVGICPPYRLLGINTNKKKGEKQNCCSL